MLDSTKVHWVGGTARIRDKRHTHKSASSIETIKQTGAKELARARVQVHFHFSRQKLFLQLFHIFIGIVCVKCKVSVS